MRKHSGTSSFFSEIPLTLLDYLRKYPEWRSIFRMPGRFFTTLSKCYSNYEPSPNADIEFNRLVAQKKIAIVGRADSIIGSGQGEIIDSYDLVVRLNDEFPHQLSLSATSLIPEHLWADIGKRTDILYNNLYYKTARAVESRLETMIRSGERYICGPFPNISPFHWYIKAHGPRIAEKLPFRLVDKVLYADLKKTLSSSPFAGTVAIMDLLQFNIQELYVAGFTCLQSEEDCIYRNRLKEEGSAHKPDNDFSWFKGIIRSDKRVKVDRILTEILHIMPNPHD